MTPGDMSDSFARYRATRAFLEECLTPGPDLARRLLEGADAGTRTLEREPREPVLLNLTGVALYELGGLDAAGELFGAAEDLAPGMTEAAANRRATRARRRHPAPRLATAVPRALPAVAERAASCAVAARVDPRQTLSLCMIVRDEEEALPRCLASMRDWI